MLFGTMKAMMTPPSLHWTESPRPLFRLLGGEDTSYLISQQVKWDVKTQANLCMGPGFCLHSQYCRIGLSFQYPRGIRSGCDILISRGAILATGDQQQSFQHAPAVLLSSVLTCHETKLDLMGISL